MLLYLVQITFLLKSKCYFINFVNFYLLEYFLIIGLQLGQPLQYESANPENVKKVPAGCYDTNDGYFDPKNLAILNYDSHEAVRIIDKEEREWILKNCRLSGEKK